MKKEKGKWIKGDHNKLDADGFVKAYKESGRNVKLPWEIEEKKVGNTMVAWCINHKPLRPGELD